MVSSHSDQRSLYPQEILVYLIIPTQRSLNIMSASRLLSEQKAVDEEEVTESEISNGKRKRRKHSRDEPTLPFHFKDEQTGF